MINLLLYSRKLERDIYVIMLIILLLKYDMYCVRRICMFLKLIMVNIRNDKVNCNFFEGVLSGFF